MADYLLIGPVLLDGFELPERVAWGGGQRLSVHRMPGGLRVIDSLGRDDDDVSWAGVFSGPDAGIRARTVDLMRADGGLWPLTWGSFFYTVTIRRFEADYARSNWIPYRIACAVLRDEAMAVLETGLSLADAILGDLAQASGLATGVPLDAAQDLVREPGALRRGTAPNREALRALRTGERAVGAGIAAAGLAMFAADAATADGQRAQRDRAGELAALAQAEGPLARARQRLENERG